MMQELRSKLAAAFHLCALKGWDNWTYTHISARSPGSDTFLINPFGTMYAAVRPKDLIEVDMNRAPSDYFDEVNPTGVYIHKAIYKRRPDINAIFHLHTSAGVAVSSMQGGLLPISQFALHFYKRLSTHAYDSLVLDEQQQTEKLAQDLGQNYSMLLENHGTLTSGRTLEEAFFYTHHLEEACKVQCLVLNSGVPPLTLSEAVCSKASHDLLSFEKNLGQRDWKAAMSLLPFDFFR